MPPRIWINSAALARLSRINFLMHAYRSGHLYGSWCYTSIPFWLLRKTCRTKRQARRSKYPLTNPVTAGSVASTSVTIIPSMNLILHTKVIWSLCPILEWSAAYFEGYSTRRAIRRSLAESVQSRREIQRSSVQLCITPRAWCRWWLSAR